MPNIIKMRSINPKLHLDQVKNHQCRSEFIAFIILYREKTNLRNLRIVLTLKPAN